MLSQKTLADIVKDEIENLIRKGEIYAYYYAYYYILLYGKIYRGYNYDEEVAEGKRSAKDIYALGAIHSSDFDDFLFYVNYLTTASVMDFVEAYLRKIGFTIEYYAVFPPTPNLKYFISAEVELNNDTPEYLVVSVYDIDALARTLHIPQIAEQELGNKPREITQYELSDIERTVTKKQPLLAGHTYMDAFDILRKYYVNHNNLIKDEDLKIFLAYMNLFPTPYEVCYEWGAGRFVETNCLKIDLRKRLKRSS